MKWFLSFFVLAAGIAIASASCGPQEHFCPTTNPNPDDFSCHANFDAMGGMGGQNQGPCDGASYVICSDGSQKCSFSECPP